MNFAGLSIAYNEEKLVKGCIKSLEGFVDNHLMIVSEKPYFGDPEPMDRTVEIAETHGADVITGVWELDHRQRNVGIQLLQDYDWIIATDVDMWMTRDDMKALCRTLERTKENAFVIPQTAYWRDIDHVLVDDFFMPVIAIRPRVRFTHIGNINVSAKILDNCRCHHINWCDPKNILKKVLTYPHAPDFKDPKKWYREHYLSWKEGQLCTMPDGHKFRVERQPLPDELRQWL